MKKLKASVSIILEKRVIKKDGTFPVKLRITYDRKSRYYGTGVSCTNEDFENIYSSKPDKKLIKHRRSLNRIEEKATDIITNISSFSFEKFEKEFNSNKVDRQNIFALLEQTIERLESEERDGTASAYRSTLNSLKKFSGKKHLKFDDISVKFLNNYEKWNINNGNSLNTVGIYLRNIRTLFNEAIANGQISKEIYPFHKRGYEIPAQKSIKKALSMQDLSKIFNYTAQEGSNEQFALDIWKFSYLCNGMNIKDIAKLKYRNLNKDTITFIRSKTARTTKKKLITISADLNDFSLDIIKRWGNITKDQENYIFPMLSTGMTTKREREIIQQRTKTINKYMKRISQALGIEEHVTTYTARYSFSNVLRNADAPIDLISEKMGHQDVKTTRGYLNSFADDIKKKWSQKLIEF